MLGGATLRWSGATVRSFDRWPWGPGGAITWAM
jgi:hypothetical protein